MMKTITPPVGVLALREHGQFAVAIADLDPDTLLTDAQAAAILGLRPSTLLTWRSRGIGLRWRRIGDGHKKCARYRLADVIDYRDRETPAPRPQTRAPRAKTRRLAVLPRRSRHIPA